MAHKTLVNGTAYEITGGKTLVNGTGYNIAKGKTLVGGTAYDIPFGITIRVTGENYIEHGYKNAEVIINGHFYYAGDTVRVSEGTKIVMGLIRFKHVSGINAIRLNGVAVGYLFEEEEDYEIWQYTMQVQSNLTVEFKISYTSLGAQYGEIEATGGT